MDRVAHRLTLQRVSFGISGPETLDFAQEVAGSLQGDFAEYQNVSLSLTDGTTTRTVFRGQIVSHSVGGIGTGVIAVGYHCLGSRWVANNQIFTTAPDGSGRWIVNRPHTDPGWSPSLSGLSVGQILTNYFAQHNGQLSALGIAQPPAADLSPLTVVPVDPVVLSGRIFDMADSVLANWGYSKYQIFIDPNANQIRVMDTTALPATGLDLCADPIQVPDLRVDIADCFTRMVLRGMGQITAAVLSQSSGTLVGGATSGGGWTPAMQSSWTWSQFANPANSLRGTITSMTASTVTADAFAGPVTTFAANYWSGSQIWVQYGFAGGGTSYQTTETAEVISNTATSGGSATFNVDVPFQNASLYTSIEIRGAPVGQSLVWRKYMIPNTVQRASDNSPINLHLVNYLMGSYPWAPVDGMVVQATGPAAEVYSGGQAFFATFQMYLSPDGSTPGYIVFDQPTCSFYSTMASMVAGTPSAPPTDVKVLLPYSMGAIQAAAPASGYQGTAYTQYGLQRTWYKDYYNWVSPQQSTNMGQLAQNFLDTVKNTVISGTLVYHGVPMPFLTVGASLNITGMIAAGTPFATMNCPVRTITIEWPDYGGAYQVTQLMFDNRRKPWSGSDNLFLHPIARRREPMAGEAFGPGAPRFAGMAGWAGAGAYQGEAPEVAYGDEGEDGRPRRRRPAPRLAPRKEREYAAAEGDRRARERRDTSREHAAEAERQEATDRDDTEALVRTDNRDRAAGLDTTSEAAQRRAGAERTRRAQERENTRRLVARDNARRRRTLGFDPVARRQVPGGPLALGPTGIAPTPDTLPPDDGTRELPG